jgi:biopolymer transport protein ExbD
MSGADLNGSKKSKSEPNVVPLCDILLVLLIIFMVVTPLLKENVNVELPEAMNTMDQPEPGHIVTVSIKDNGTVYLDAVQVGDLGKLAMMIEDKIAENNQFDKNKLLLKVDREIVYGRVTRVMEEIRKAQIEIVGLVAQEKIVHK